MNHEVVINLIGMPGKRGPRRFTGAAGSCAQALARAAATMPTDVRKAWYRAEWDDEKKFMVDGLRKFRIREKHTRLA